MYDKRLRSYRPKWFKTWELVSKAAYQARGEKAMLGMDARLLITIDELRTLLSEIDPKKAALICNNWKAGGSRGYSGLRLASDKYFTPFSAHGRGQAVDLISNHYTAQELRDLIIKHKDRFPYLTRMEEGVSWLHLDVFNLPEDAPEKAILLFTKSGETRYA
ncbi:hypothetical protein [Vibrio parahaemolyticus]|uniref:hypothetical protein n=1 Tax=Vibrio parahaemolyticus TaxID=670 RepID=UPI00111E5E6E|nr:hypothetical protein [Vibrio parahaemolyticus]TOA43694.1 hypothetical protein CGK26_23105 [Vibrio parahaemolyticus]